MESSRGHGGAPHGAVLVDACESVSLTASPVRRPPADFPAETTTSAAPAAAALALIEIVERVKSHLDALVLPAWRMLHTAYVEALDEPGRPPMTARERDWESSVARSGAADDVMAATGLGETECRRRLALALADPARVDTLVRLLVTGELALWQVLGLHDDTAELEARAADDVVRAVTAPSRTGERPSAALRRRRLRRELVRHRAESACTTTALAARDARAELQSDDTGTLRIAGEGGRVVAAIERVDRVARGIRAAGLHPDRTLAQLRSDVALDLILNTPVLTGADWSGLGELPRAQVQVVIGLDVLAGATDGVAELPGHGWLSGSSARDLAHAPGSTWQRLLADPVTGALVELSTIRYTPPPRLRAHVVARDRVCRAPGCQVAAEVCDLDHDTPWPLGETSADNLSAKHRRHHQLKTTGLWSSRHDPATGAMSWTTLAGRSYSTDPFDYRELIDTGVASRSAPRDVATATRDVATATRDGATTTPDVVTTTPDVATTTPDVVTTTRDGVTTTRDGVTGWKLPTDSSAGPHPADTLGNPHTLANRHTLGNLHTPDDADDGPLVRHRGTAPRSAQPAMDEDQRSGPGDRSLTVVGIGARPDGSATATTTENSRDLGGIPRQDPANDPPPY